MEILLTGAAGFIGAELARLLLAEGHRVHVLLRPSSDPWRIRDLLPRLEVLSADLNDTGLVDRLRGRRMDLCIHCAWYAKPGAYLRASENIESLEATFRLLKVMAEAGCPRFVGLGSVLEYDSRTGYLTEDSPVRPESLYGACKLACLNITEKLILGTGMSFVWPRIFNLFGPRENKARLLPDVILGLLRGDRVKLTPGEQWMDFLHVEDVARAIWHVAGSSLTGPVNIGSGNPVQVKTLVGLAASAVGRMDLLDFGALSYNPLSPMFTCANNKRLRDSGWQPKYTLADGVSHTVEWWRSQLGS